MKATITCIQIYIYIPYLIRYKSLPWFLLDFWDTLSSMWLSFSLAQRSDVLVFNTCLIIVSLPSNVYDAQVISSLYIPFISSPSSWHWPLKIFRIWSSIFCSVLCLMCLCRPTIFFCFFQKKKLSLHILLFQTRCSQCLIPCRQVLSKYFSLSVPLYASKRSLGLLQGIDDGKAKVILSLDPSLLTPV